jgi:YHS domain-containing protein
MKILTKFTCLAALGATLATFTTTASAGEGCCAAATPMADAAKSDAAAKPYPLDTCIVSDEKLGADPDMKPYVFVHEGQEIKLCCKSCKKKFDKSPETYLKKLKDAPAKK